MPKRSVLEKVCTRKGLYGKGFAVLLYWPSDSEVIPTRLKFDFHVKTERSRFKNAHVF